MSFTNYRDEPKRRAEELSAQQRAYAKQLTEEVELLTSVTHAKGWAYTKKMFTALADKEHATASKATDAVTMARALGAEDAYRAAFATIEALISSKQRELSQHKDL